MFISKFQDEIFKDGFTFESRNIIHILYFASISVPDIIINHLKPCTLLSQYI